MRKTQVRVRVWSILLTCAMLISLLPTNAFAAVRSNGTVIKVGEGETYTDIHTALAAADDGDTILLTGDIGLETKALWLA